MTFNLDFKMFMMIDKKYYKMEKKTDFSGIFAENWIRQGL